MKNDILDGFKLIHAYTRADALADGVLIDVTSSAKKAGFGIPVAVTCSIWNMVFPDKQPASMEAADESEKNLIMDMLQLLYITIKMDSRKQEELQFPYVASRDKDIKLFVFKAVIGPGDTAEPVLTIMLPEED